MISIIYLPNILNTHIERDDIPFELKYNGYFYRILYVEHSEITIIITLLNRLYIQ